MGKIKDWRDEIIILLIVFVFFWFLGRESAKMNQCDRESEYFDANECYAQEHDYNLNQ